MPHGKLTKLTLTDYIINNLLPWWMKCIKCNRWRQIPLSLGARNEILKNEFTCSVIVKACLLDDWNFTAYMILYYC